MGEMAVVGDVVVEEAFEVVEGPQLGRWWGWHGCDGGDLGVEGQFVTEAHAGRLLRCGGG